MPTEREVSKVKSVDFDCRRFVPDRFQIAIAYQPQCSFCEGPCIGDYLRCRVCIKVYHCQCLSDRGHTEIQTLRFTRLGKQDWACPECVRFTDFSCRFLATEDFLSERFKPNFATRRNQRVDQHFRTNRPKERSNKVVHLSKEDFQQNSSSFVYSSPRDQKLTQKSFFLKSFDDLSFSFLFSFDVKQQKNEFCFLLKTVRSAGANFANSWRKKNFPKFCDRLSKISKIWKKNSTRWTLNKTAKSTGSSSVSSSRVKSWREKTEFDFDKQFLSEKRKVSFLPDWTDDDSHRQGIGHG